MGGGTPSRTTSTNITEYPPWLASAMQNNIALANDLASQRDAQGYQNYAASDRIADFNPLQLNAIQNAQNSVGNWTPAVQAGIDATGQSADIARNVVQNPAQAAYAGPSALVRSGSLATSNLSQYMNPYTDMVTNNALGKLEQQRQMAITSNSDAAAKARAFGGSRHGVVDSLTNQGYGQQAADLALNAAQSNFANAQNMANTDINRNLQAQGMNQQAWNQMAQYNAGMAQQANLANQSAALDAAGQLQSAGSQYGSLANLYQSLNSNDMNNLMTAGNMYQDQDQMMRDWNYQQWLNAYNFPVDNLNLRYGAVTSTPYQPGYSTTGPGPSRNRTAGFLGGAASGAAVGSAVPVIGTGWGALIGGLLGAYG